jgi:hypothetical protein
VFCNIQNQTKMCRISLSTRRDGERWRAQREEADVAYSEKTGRLFSIRTLQVTSVMSPARSDIGIVDAANRG